MFFAKQTGYHGLLLYVHNEHPHPTLVVMPSEVSNDIISTMKKFERSPLNDPKFIGNHGRFTVVYDIQSFTKISIHHDAYPWSEPILYTDYAKSLAARLQALVKDEDEDVQEELVYFVGEFTMMQDNGFVAPF